MLNRQFSKYPTTPRASVRDLALGAAACTVAGVAIWIVYLYLEMPLTAADICVWAGIVLFIPSLRFDKKVVITVALILFTGALFAVFLFN